MRQDIRLFIGGNEIEFNADPKILFNYKVTDINNPTVVKNGYTKTIEVEGTPKNNDAFQNIWNLERVQFAGVNFNPIKKTDFTIYVNGEIYEKGYAKLDGITTKNNKSSYSITLFGGLGSFFFNLNFKDSEGADKKSLADLNFSERYSYSDGTGRYNNVDPDLTFRINKDTVWDAWMQLSGDPDAVYDPEDADRPNNYLWDEKWEILNFAAAYNGVPSDFDADKAIINRNGMPALDFERTDGGTSYTDFQGYISGENPNDEMTEWETFDLRSYLQRPVVKFQRVIDACCNPLNNGGYEVVLDPSFFNHENPYYRDSYLTLPMLRDNIEGGEVTNTTTGEIVYKSGAVAGESIEMRHYVVEFEDPSTISQITNVDLGLRLDFKVSASDSQLYLYNKIEATPSQKGDTTRVSTIESISSVSVQLVAYDALDNVAASSNVYFVTDKNAANKATFSYHSYWHENGIPVPGVTNIYGSFKKVGTNLYRLVDDSDNPIILGFSFASDNPFKRLELKLLPVTYNDIWFKYAYKWWKSKDYNGLHRMEYFAKPYRMFNRLYNHYSGDIGVDAALARYGYDATTDMRIADFNLISKDYNEFFSNTLVKKESILKTDNTPSDYLLSFAKMFGLHFYSDPSETASDPNLAPNGVIHIMTRDTFYTGEVVNVMDLIDREKGIKITPSTVESKWFNFNIKQVDSEVNKEYTDKFGYDYGYQKINTGYNFNADNKALMDKVVFKAGVEVLETSKYYQVPIEGYPAYGWNGFVYSLYHESADELDSLEIDEMRERIYRNSINPNGWDDTDAFRKVQFHEKDNGAVDGKDVLLFYSGEDFYTSRFNYWLTDDIEQMIQLNDGKPCWIMTAEETDMSGERIAYRINTIPVFSRNIIYGGNGTIKHSWDFGNPFMTFVRDTFVGEQSGLYYKCWKDYVTDLYDQDNRVLNAYLVFKDRPNAGLLRKFFWFDNTLWRLNAIKEWNIAEIAPTAVEFVKVIDPENYELTPITNTIIASFTFPNLENADAEFGGDDRNHYYRISADAQSVTGVINLGNAGSWVFGDGRGADYSVKWTDGTAEYGLYTEIMTPPNDFGSGDAIKVFHLTANNKNLERTWRFYIQDDADRSYFVNIIQAAGNAPVITNTFELDPSSISIPSAGGTRTVYLRNNTTDRYTIGDTPSWISIENIEDNSFDVRVSANTGDFARVGRIAVTASTEGAPDVTKYLLISQANAVGSVSFDKTVITVGANAGEESNEVNIEFKNIQDRTFNVTPSDRFMFVLVGTGGSIFKIRALQTNNGSSAITGTFTVTAKDTAGNTITKSITIVQTPS